MVRPGQEARACDFKGTSHMPEARNMFKYFAEQGMSLVKGYQNFRGILFHF